MRGFLGTHNIDTQYCDSLVSLVGLAGIRVCPQTRPAARTSDCLRASLKKGALTSLHPYPNGPHGLYQQVSVATPFTTFT